MGLDVDEHNFYTSALATAQFIRAPRCRGASAYVVGDPGLHERAL